MVTTALMLRAVECHKELAQTISLLLALTLGRANGNWEKFLQQCPYCEEIWLLLRSPEIQGLMKFN